MIDNKQVQAGLKLVQWTRLRPNATMRAEHPNAIALLAAKIQSITIQDQYRKEHEKENEENEWLITTEGGQAIRVNLAFLLRSVPVEGAWLVYNGKDAGGCIPDQRVSEWYSMEN